MVCIVIVNYPVSYTNLIILRWLKTIRIDQIYDLLQYSVPLPMLEDHRFRDVGSDLLMNFGPVARFCISVKCEFNELDLDSTAAPPCLHEPEKTLH